MQLPGKVHTIGRRDQDGLAPPEIPARGRLARAKKGSEKLLMGISPLNIRGSARAG